MIPIGTFVKYKNEPFKQFNSSKIKVLRPWFPDTTNDKRWLDFQEKGDGVMVSIEAKDGITYQMVFEEELQMVLPELKIIRQ